MPSPPPIETGKPVLAVEGDSAFGFSGMEVETICRYKLPVCVVIFNNDGIYRGTDVNKAGSDPATTVFVKGSRYDKMIEAFGGVGVNATSPDELRRAVNAGHGLRQADPHQRGDRSGGRQRERPHRQPQPAKRAEEEIRPGEFSMSWFGRSKASLQQGQTNQAREARMGKALEGVKILDFTHVQSGPTCTQLLAWFGADVIKVERPGVGDITRGQLQDIPKVDSLYFTMLNHNKRSITIDSKNKKGMEILERLVKKCDVLVENFAPGALDRMGLTWERIQQLNPRMIYALGQGLRPRPLRGLQGLRERRPVHGRLGLHHRLPRRPAAGDRRADRRLRHRPASGARHRHGALSPHHVAARASASPAPCRTACSTWRA